MKHVGETWFINPIPGLSVTCGRDGTIHATYRTTTIQCATKDVYFHVWYHTVFSKLILYSLHRRSESPIVAKLQYGMKITFIFILILFIDSVNRVYRVQVELAESKDLGGYVSLLATALVSSRYRTD